MLSQLNIQHFRNIVETTIEPHQKWNIISGDNAAGKTAFLEAIYYLGRGRSFRTSNPTQLIQHQQSETVVAGKVISAIENISRPSTIGIRRQKDNTLVRINGESHHSSIELARHLPILFIGPDIHKLLTEGPALRRRFIDWGVFHLNNQFFNSWRHYQKALKQRNALLRQYREMPDSVASWHLSMSNAADEIDQMRSEFIEMFELAFQDVLSILLPEHELTLQYQRGWSADTTLREVLQQEWQGDQKYSHTRSGPHRAELAIKIAGKPAIERLSQGQRKLAAISMLIAQSYIFSEITSKALIFLIDDLPAELDKVNLERVLSLLSQIETQCFMTTTDIQYLSMLIEQPHQHFLLDQGQIC